MNKRQVVNIISLIVVLAANTLANVLPLNGQTTGQVSDQFPLYFTPAGYVFSIWSLIYLGLIGFTIYQALPAQRDNPRLKRLGYWFALSNLFNTAWIFLWHYEQFPATLVAMLALLASLIGIYLWLGIGRTRSSLIEKLLVELPFSIYLGWIAVATVANTSVVLYTLGWNGGALGPVVWTQIMIAVAAVLAIAMIIMRREVAYPLVYVWASIGIAASNPETPVIQTTAFLFAGIVLAAALAFAVVRWLRRRRAGMASLAI